MILKNSRSLILFIIITGLWIIVLTACTSNGPQIIEVTRVIPQTVVVTELVLQIVEKVVTATSEPVTTTPEMATETSVGTAVGTPENVPTVENSSTQAPPLVDTQAGGLTTWCMPMREAKLSETPTTSNIPPHAWASKQGSKFIEQEIPATTCTFLFTFNQPVPKGTMMEIYEFNQKSPWYKKELTPATDNPNIAMVTIKHGMVVSPPFWDITYQFAVRAPDGTQLRMDAVHFWKVTPEPCWDGSLPNPVTMYCPSIDQ